MYVCRAASTGDNYVEIFIALGAYFEMASHIRVIHIVMHPSQTILHFHSVVSHKLWLCHVHAHAAMHLITKTV